MVTWLNMTLLPPWFTSTSQLRATHTPRREPVSNTVREGRAGPARGSLLPNVSFRSTLSCRETPRPQSAMLTSHTYHTNDKRGPHVQRPSYLEKNGCDWRLR